MAAATARLGKLLPTRTALMVCDLQEKFRPLIAGMPAVIDTTRRLVRASNIIGVPVLVTEQYPKALGATMDEVAEVLDAHAWVVPKTQFSMYVPEVQEVLRRHSAIGQVLLCGIEAHVCVLQTGLDLLDQGYEVHLVVDGVSSQRVSDRSVALSRLAQCGALLTTWEMALFQLLRDAKHPHFKEVSAIVKEPRPREQLPIISKL